MSAVPHLYNLNQSLLPSEKTHVTHARDPYDSTRPNGANRLCPDGQSVWVLKLAALTSDEPERFVRYLTGALLACGGWILTRTTQGNHSAELDFEFARASCVEIYAVLMAAGLALSRDSHYQLADLCHCTTNLIDSRALDIVRVILTVRDSASAPGHHDFAPEMAA